MYVFTLAVSSVLAGDVATKLLPKLVKLLLPTVNGEEAETAVTVTYNILQRNLVQIKQTLLSEDLS